MRPLLIVRPQPGADRTKARALELGWKVVVAPIFTVVSTEWEAPDPACCDALMLTSANAVRNAGPALLRYTALPVFAVGKETARAAVEAGFTDVQTGSGDAAALSEMMSRADIRRPLHLTGREHRAASRPGLAVEHRIVYAADAASSLPPSVAAALTEGAIPLLHSPRAGATLARLLGESGVPPSTISVAAISAAAAAGDWKEAAVAAAPNDAALLAAAARLCEKR